MSGPDHFQLPGYPIFHKNGWQNLHDFIDGRGPFSQIITVCDENTARLCFPLFKEKTGLPLAQPITIPAGEAAKNLRTAELLYRFFFEKKLDRSGLVILLGGGVVGDLGGFAAATWVRGVPFVQVPTTLLSMVDSSIGGKLGIDFGGAKNMVGVFRDPLAVAICPEFLGTLPGRELRSGFAEMAKHALISSKKDWQLLKTAPPSLDGLDWSALIPRSLLVKKEVVEKDPFERGLRKVLNFGHTVGHAVEALFLEKEEPLLHGEAIAIGMACEAWLSWKLAGLSEKERDEVAAFFLQIFGKTDWPEAENPRLVELMRHDKKNSGGSLRFSLLKEIGSPVWDVPVAEAEVLEALRFYQRL